MALYELGGSDTGHGHRFEIDIGGLRFRIYACHSTIMPSDQRKLLSGFHHWVGYGGRHPDFTRLVDVVSLANLRKPVISIL